MPDPRYRILYFPSLPSTNAQAKTLADGGARAGTVVLAGAQSEGRGRRGHTFFSPAGKGLYESVVLRPTSDFPLSRLTPFAAVAAARAIDRLCGTAVGIKWVNDLFLDGRKIGGILAERVAGDDPYVVLGIGINVKHTDFPEELQTVAGSLEDLAPRVPSPLALAEATLGELVPLLDGRLPDGFMDDYRARSLFLGKDVVSVTDASLTGTVTGIDDDGALLLATAEGIRKIVAGEMSFRPKTDEKA